jgi:hypothetical protein
MRRRPHPNNLRLLHCWSGGGRCLPSSCHPPHLPDPAGLLQFDVDEKKNEIFESAREKIRSKAQYTKNVSSHQCTAYSHSGFYSTRPFVLSDIALCIAVRSEKEALDAIHDQSSHQAGDDR